MHPCVRMPVGSGLTSSVCLLTIYQIQSPFFLYICELLLKVLSAGCIQIRPSFLISVSVVIPGHSETLTPTRTQSSNLEKLAFMSLSCVPPSSEGRVLVRGGFYFACCNTSFEKPDAPGVLWGIKVECNNQKLEQPLIKTACLVSEAFLLSIK